MDGGWRPRRSREVITRVGAASHCMTSTSGLIQAFVRDGHRVMRRQELLPRRLRAGLEPLAERNRVGGDGTMRARHGHRALRVVPRTHRTRVVLRVLHLVFGFRDKRKFVIVVVAAIAFSSGP